MRDGQQMYTTRERAQHVEAPATEMADWLKRNEATDLAKPSNTCAAPIRIFSPMRRSTSCSRPARSGGENSHDC